MEKSDFEELSEEIIKEVKGIKIEKDYSNLGLKFNPFPPAGIPRYPFLPPLDPDAKGTIRDFIKSTYSYLTDEKEEFVNYAGLAIVGDYGMGKTHLMEYTKMFIEYLNETEKDVFSAATCFIDRPEESPQRVIHHIVEQIGPDTIRKYVWMILIDEFQRDTDSFYEQFRPRQQTLLGREKWDKLFAEPTKSNYLEFLRKFKEMQGDVKLLQEEAREIIKKKIIMDDTLADRYLSLIFPEKKANTSWEILAGYISAKDLQRKEVKFLNSIVRILRENGFNLLYVFIDEFEDVSKIKGAKLTNYLTTLNTLINNERSWAVITSLNEDALAKIKEESPPLYDRLTSYKVELKPLDEEGAKRLIVHYLNLARKNEENSISPFSEELIQKALRSSEGNYRSFIRLAHKAIEYAVLNKLEPPLSENIMKRIRDIAT